MKSNISLLVSASFKPSLSTCTVEGSSRGTRAAASKAKRAVQMMEAVQRLLLLGRVHARHVHAAALTATHHRHVFAASTIPPDCWGCAGLSAIGSSAEMFMLPHIMPPLATGVDACAC
jgi:hypothetical protein